MCPKRVALPFPPASVELERAAEFIALSPEDRLNELVRQRAELARQLEILDARVEASAVETICGIDDLQNVELYDGTLGVTREFVDAHERPVGQIQWLDDLAARYDDPGDVSGVRWCSGGLVTDDIFLTAGHCFDSFGGGWVRPKRNGQTIAPEEIATVMQVNFNYQVAADTSQVRPGESFPILELLEYRLGSLDFAVIRLGKDSQGSLPGERWGHMVLAGQDLTQQGAMLCLIQHPNGLPKKIEAGPMRANIGGEISYDSLDTLGGSSGSLILSPKGTVVGVHTNGGCTYFSGFNYGLSIGSIINASSIVRQLT